MTLNNHYDGYAVSLRKQIFCLLDKDPLLSPSMMCDRLRLDFKRYHQLVANYKQSWKHTHESERGSKCSSFHCVRWGLWERVTADREAALGVGWVQSKAKNRFLVFKNVLGRAVWFETGTVRLHVRSPGDEARAKQLFCAAFFRNGLVFDVNVLNRFLGSLFLDSFHTVVKTGQRLPYVHIRDFAGTNGFEFKSGDRTHPHCFEFIVNYQSQFDEARRKFMDLVESFQAPANGVNAEDGKQTRIQEYLV